MNMRLREQGLPSTERYKLLFQIAVVVLVSVDNLAIVQKQF